MDQQAITSGTDQPVPHRFSEVVIVGAGFAGLEVAKALGQAGLEATVIDRSNHHLFQPLLYQVATAALSATDVAEPIRKILRRYRSVRVIYGDVTDIDTGARLVRMASGHSVGYRYLVIASGAKHGYFGHDEWADWAPGLKTIEDARQIRSRLLLTFEQAERTTDAAERERFLSVAIIGGGPTGVEMAGAIAELSRQTLAHDFRSIDPQATRIMLVEAAPRLLSAFSEDSADYAMARLKKMGVRVRTGAEVTHVGPGVVRVAGEDLPVGLVIWAAGVKASPLAGQLGATDKAGRIAVDETLRVPGHENVFALGDLAILIDEKGAPLPGLAQVARQQGIHLGRSLAAHIRSGKQMAPFRYVSRGNSAIVGKNAAIFEHGRFRVKGALAWIAWALIHVYLLVGFQNRLFVSMRWFWRYLTSDRGARLIAGDVAQRIDPAKSSLTTRQLERANPASPPRSG